MKTPRQWCDQLFVGDCGTITIDAIRMILADGIHYAANLSGPLSAVHAHIYADTLERIAMGAELPGDRDTEAHP